MNITIKKAVFHIKTVLSHKKLVLKLSFSAGIPFRGLVHDLSKFSPTELFESISYYTDGKQSPILNCIKKCNYSKAWAHHISHNKHHPEYWQGNDRFPNARIIPYKYWVEMICDNLAAGLNYKKDDWTKEHQLNFWRRRIKKWDYKINFFIHPAILGATTEIFEQVAKHGIATVICRKELKQVYKKHLKK